MAKHKKVVEDSVSEDLRSSVGEVFQELADTPVQENTVDTAVEKEYPSHAVDTLSQHLNREVKAQLEDGSWALIIPLDTYMPQVSCRVGIPETWYGLVVKRGLHGT